MAGLRDPGIISLRLLSSVTPFGVWAPSHHQNDLENKCTVLKFFSPAKGDIFKLYVRIT